MALRMQVRRTLRSRIFAAQTNQDHNDQRGSAGIDAAALAVFIGFAFDDEMMFKEKKTEAGCLRMRRTHPSRARLNPA